MNRREKKNTENAEIGSEDFLSKTKNGRKSLKSEEK